MSQELSEEIVEVLARNVHDVWMKHRIEEGWAWGKERDDNNRLHPNIVPYECLSEADKDYDRNTALAVLRTIRSLGYSIVKEE